MQDPDPRSWPFIRCVANSPVLCRTRSPEVRFLSWLKEQGWHLMTSDLVQPCVWPMCCTAGMRWNHFFSRTSTYIWSLGGPVMTIKPLNWLAARYITHWCSQTYICWSKTSEPCSSVVWPCLPDLEPALHWCYQSIALPYPFIHLNQTVITHGGNVRRMRFKRR